MKKILWVAGFLVALGGCANMGGPAESEVNKAIAEAEAEIKQAKAMNALWLHTEKFLKEAQQAKKEGNNAEALKKAKKAAKEAKLAQQQAKEQAATAKFNLPPI